VISHRAHQTRRCELTHTATGQKLLHFDKFTQMSWKCAIYLFFANP